MQPPSPTHTFIGMIVRSRSETALLREMRRRQPADLLVVGDHAMALHARMIVAIDHHQGAAEPADLAEIFDHQLRIAGLGVESGSDGGTPDAQLSKPFRGLDRFHVLRSAVVAAAEL